MKFWIMLLVFAVLGAVGIYFGAPKTRDVMPPRVAEQIDEMQATVDRARVARVTAPRVTGQGASDFETTTVQQNDGEDDTPSLMGVMLARQGDKSAWGVVNTDAAVYNLTGKLTGTVTGGQIFVFRKAHRSSVGNTLEGYIKGDSAKTTVLLQQKDVYLFTGSYNRLSERQRRALTQYYADKAACEKRIKEIQKADAERCPHYEEAVTAARRSKEFAERARSLMLTIGATQDPAKLQKMQDELRQMKNEQSSYERTSKEANAKFTAWKKANLSSFANPEMDATVKKLRKTMAESAQCIAGLAL